MPRLTDSTSYVGVVPYRRKVTLHRTLITTPAFACADRSVGLLGVGPLLGVGGMKLRRVRLPQRRQ